MAEFDLKSQLDLLNDYLDREMESVKTEYYVIKPDGKGNGRNRPMTVNGNVSTNRTNGSPYGCDLDRQLPPPPLCTWESYNSNSASCPPQTVSRNRTKAMDIIDPETGKKVQL